MLYLYNILLGGYIMGMYRRRLLVLPSRFIGWLILKVFKFLPILKTRIKEQEESFYVWYEIRTNNLPPEEREAARKKFAELSFEEKRRLCELPKMIRF